MPPKKRKRVDVENDAKDDKTVRETATNNGKRKKVLAKKKTAAPSKPAEAYSYWLMKSEPETRIENGVDVKTRPRTRSQTQPVPRTRFQHRALGVKTPQQCLTTEAKLRRSVLSTSRKRHGHTETIPQSKQSLAMVTPGELVRLSSITSAPSQARQPVVRQEVELALPAENPNSDLDSDPPVASPNMPSASNMSGVLGQMHAQCLALSDASRELTTSIQDLVDQARISTTLNCFPNKDTLSSARFPNQLKALLQLTGALSEALATNQSKALLQKSDCGSQTIISEATGATIVALTTNQSNALLQASDIGSRPIISEATGATSEALATNQSKALLQKSDCGSQTIISEATDATGGSPLDRFVKAKLKAKIKKNKFVDFAKLLDGYVLKNCDGSASIASFDEWVFAFHIFVCVYSKAHPFETPYLMEYADSIQDLVRRAGLAAAMFYDVSFRKLHHRQPTVPWARMNSDLVSRAINMRSNPTPLDQTASHSKTSNPIPPHKTTSRTKPTKITPAYHMTSNSKPTKKPKQSCWNYIRKGVCPKGSQCKFAHY